MAQPVDGLSRAEFRYSLSGIKVTYWLIMALGIAFLLLSGLPFLERPVNFIGVGFLAAMGVAAIAFATWNRKRRENDREPKLVVDATMIHPVTATAKQIPWEEVEKIVFVRPRPKKPGYMAIDVKGDITRFEPTRGTKMMAKANAMVGHGEITVRSLDLDATHEQIKEAIQAVNPNVVVLDK